MAINYNFPQAPDPSNNINEQTKRLLALIQNRPMSTGQALGAGAMKIAGKGLDYYVQHKTLKENLDMAMSQDPRSRAQGLLSLGITPPEMIGKSAEQQAKLTEEKAKAQALGKKEGEGELMAGDLPGNASVDTSMFGPDYDLMPPDAKKRYRQEYAKQQASFDFDNRNQDNPRAEKSKLANEKFWASEWDKANRVLNPSVAVRGTALGVVGQNNNRLLRIASNLNNPRIIDQELALAEVDTAAVTSGGVPHEKQLAKSSFDNLKRRLAEVKSFITSNPQALNNPETVNRIKQMMGGIVAADNKLIKDNLKTSRVTLRHLYKNDPQRWNDMEQSIISSLPNENFEITPQGGGTPQSQGKPDDIDALINKHL